MTDRPHDRPETSHPDQQPTSEARGDGRVYVPWSRIELPEESNGWHAPELASNPDRPDSRDIHLPADRRTHILDGDPGHTGGGHRHGTGRPLKTEFPERWNDAATSAYILDVARSPDTQPIQGTNRRWVCQGRRDGVDIVAIVWPEGKIWAAWPLPGGRGVTQNPGLEERS